MEQLEPVLDQIVVAGPRDGSTPGGEHLCADKGYDHPCARQSIMARDYIEHMRSRGQERAEKIAISGYRARRWVVEACHSWLNRFREILVRFEKTHASHVALLHLACAITVCRRLGVIYGEVLRGNT